jgi:hypothetical protein
MGFRIVVVVVLAILVLLSSGCICFPIKPGPTPDPDNRGNTNPTGVPSMDDAAGDLIGNWSFSVMADKSIAHPNYTAEVIFLKLGRDGVFGLIVTLLRPDGTIHAVTYTGGYQAIGNSVRFSDIINNDYPDANKTAHTSKKLADCTSTYQLTSGGDTLQIKDGIMGNITVTLDKEIKNPSTGGSSNPGKSTSTGGADLIVGTWSGGSSSSYVDSYGNYAGDSWFLDGYVFAKDGSYTYDAMSSSYGQITYDSHYEGKYRVNGNTITLYDRVWSQYSSTGKLIQSTKPKDSTITYSVISHDKIDITSSLGNTNEYRRKGS